MQKALVLLWTLFLFGGTSAQLAIIKDRDGFSNIREGAGTGFKIRDTLSNHKIIFCFEEEDKGGWLPVDYNKNGETHSGYIHRSRVVFLDSLPRFAVAASSDTTLRLQHEGMTLTLETGAFRPKGRRIQYNQPEGETPYVKWVDGKQPWGTDGNLPRREYRSIQLKSGSKTVPVARVHYSDLFEPNFHWTAAYLDKTSNRVYLSAINSDGAGGYLVVWVWKGGRLIARETLLPY